MTAWVRLLAGKFAQSRHDSLVHTCAVRDAEDVVLAHLVFEPLGSLRRGGGCDGTVDGVFLACETVAKQTIHGSLTFLAAVGYRGADSVIAERCDYLGRSVWSSPASAGVLNDRRRDTCSILVSAAAPRHREYHECERYPPHLLFLPVRCILESSRRACKSEGSSWGELGQFPALSEAPEPRGYAEPALAGRI